MKIIATVLFVCFSWYIGLAQDLIPKEWPHLVGYWKFQDVKNLTKPTVGKNLTLVGTHQQVQGAAYGDTAIRIAVGSYYKYAHGIAPNGGGDSVNRYTLMFDFKVLNFKRWHTFFQTDTTNANDGECFIRPIGTKPARIGTATTGYTPDSINANQWFRLVISVNLNNYYRYYINGKLWLDGDTQQVDDRFALLPKLLLFADNDKEDDTIDISSVAIFDTCLSSKEIAKIGTIEPCIANPPKVYLGKDTTLCINQSISLNAGLNFIKYQWSTGTGLPFETIHPYSLGLGKKQVWVKVTDRNGCTAADTIFLTYLDIPKVDLGVDKTFCQGQSIKLTTGSLSSNSYLWKLMPGGTSLSTSNTLTVDTSGKYMVEVTSTNGCINTDTVIVTMLNTPGKPKINITGNTNLCKGDSVRLEGPASYSKYSWSNGSNLQTIYSNKKEVLTLKVTGSNGCESQSSDTVRVAVFDFPKAPVIQFMGNTSICNGDSILFFVTSGYKDYIWQDGKGSDLRIVKQAGIYNVYVKDTNNCVSPLSNSVFITVLSSPAKPKIIGKLSFCEGETTTLSVLETNTNYLWTDSIKTKTNTIGKPGIYKIRIIGKSGCPSPWSDGVSVTEIPLPPIPAVMNGSKDSLKSSLVSERYKWYLNGTPLPDTTYSIYHFHSGYFQLQIAEKGCWSKLSESKYFINAGSQEPLNKKLKLLIIPNPLINEALIRIENINITCIAKIYIYDLKAKKIIEEDVSCLKLNQGLVLNVENLKRGYYLLRVLTNDSIYHQSFEKL
ncbi:MAG: hypothetical protein ACKVQB_03805 [Bacteroidia bacterium]